MPGVTLAKFEAPALQLSASKYEYLITAKEMHFSLLILNVYTSFLYGVICSKTGIHKGKRFYMQFSQS